jgi:sulfur carrier protein
MNVLVNGTPRTLAEGTTIRRLLEVLKLPTRGIAVEVNQEIVPGSKHAERELKDGDRLEIVSLVGGG